MKQFFRYILFSLITLNLGVTLLSCHDDKKIIEVGNVTVTTSARPLRSGNTGDRFVATVHCTGKGWVATCTSDWVELSATEGINGDYIYLEVAESQIQENRYAVIRFYDVNDPNTLSDYVEIIQKGKTEVVNALLTEKMDKKHRLGYGYNIFGSFVSDNSFSAKPVLEYDAMLRQEEAGRQMITEDLRHVEELEIISANTLTELRSKLTTSETTDSKFLGCGKTTTEDTEIYKEKSSDQECGMIRLKQIVTSRTIDLGAVYSVLRQPTSDINCELYSPEFKAALKKIREASGDDRKDALKSLYQTFGSHFVLSADLGGEIRINTKIERETSVESTHSVTTISRKIFGKKVSGSTNVKDKYSSDTKIKYVLDLTITGGSEEKQKPIKNKVSNFDIKQPITDDEIIAWQQSFQFPTSKGASTENYNASMVNCRLIPLYDLINDNVIAEEFKKYLISLNAVQQTESDHQEPAQFSLQSLHPAQKDSNDESDLYTRTVKVNDQLRAVIGSEYIPTIRSDRPCLVAYPIVAKCPFMYCGIFVGDSEHLPGVIRWLGNNCLYEPEEAFASDSLGYKEMLDENGQLKNLYLYWGAVKMFPNDAVNCKATGQIALAKMKLPSDACATTNPNVVKVGPYYWTRSFLIPRKSSTENLKTYSYDGATYASTGTDPDEWAKVSHAYRKYLPNSTQARSVMYFLNGLTGMMENSYFTKIGKKNGNTFVGANMLGLNWVKGYIAVPEKGKQVYPCDMNSWLVPTYEGGRLCITRLSKSGGATTMNYGDYIQSVGYLDTQFEKFVPFYFCTNEVY